MSDPVRAEASRPDDETLGVALLEACSQAFESLGYFFVEPLDERDAVAGPSAAVEFVGPWTGAIIVSVTSDVLTALSANMLGLDDAPEPAMQLDALGELTNVVCGSVLPALGGPRAVFSLEAPRSGPSASALAKGRTAFVARVVLDLDGGRGEVRWFID